MAAPRLPLPRGLRAVAAGRGALRRPGPCARDTRTRAALQTAARLGCAPLETSLRMLARHAGVSPRKTLEATDGRDGSPCRRAPRTPAALPVPLTPRERDVLQILTEGFSNQQIARRLFISESTVSVHVSHILAKLGVSNRLQAAAAAQRPQPLPLGAATGVELGNRRRQGEMVDMAHPCRTLNPGTTLHACDSEQSTKTLCGKDVHGPTVGTVWGFKAVCSGCYPEEKDGAGARRDAADPRARKWKDGLE